MSPEGGINPSTGTVALQKEIANISAGQVSVGFNLKYSGNVFKEAKKANDETSSGIVGLGWSLGRSQIICDCKKNSYLDDDEYFLVTAEGNRYKIFEEKSWRKQFKVDYNENAPEKWWIEGNPFWKIERIVGESIIPEEGSIVWKFVKGWKITDAEGIEHVYGDVDETNSLTGPVANATEYDLIWLQYKDGNATKPSFGLMEDAYGDVPSYYPVKWNIAKEISINKETLVYSYEQIYERLSGVFKINGTVSSWNSQIGYTKESYLTKVEASDGSRVDFYYENKGEGEFYGEYADSDGEIERLDDDGSDMFKEKIFRKYLSSVKVYGPSYKNSLGSKDNENDNYLGKVTLCYSTLQKDTPYIKRLLSMIRYFNKDDKEIDFEEYSYFTDVESSQISSSENVPYPLGALSSVKGKNCGWIQYRYSYESMGEGHVETIPLDKVFGRGYLSNGNSYLVGLKDKSLQIYTRVLGRWIKTDIKDEKGNPIKNVDKVSLGDSDWFLTVSEDEKASVFQWNGKNWQRVVKDIPTTAANVVAGPDYIVHTSVVDDDCLKIHFIWTKWGGLLDEIKVNGIRGGGVIPLKNFLMVYYQDNSISCTGNCLGYKLYAFRNGSFIHVDSYNDVDSENKVAMNGSFIYDVGEGDHWYSDSRVLLYNWNGHKWERHCKYNFNNSSVADVQSYGSDYYAVRYNGERHLRIFNFDGNLWNGEALHDKLFNYHMSGNFYWKGVGTEDFLATTRSYRRKWWTDTYTNTRIKLYYHKNGNSWAQHDYSWIDGYKYDEKKLIIGSDWFVEKESTKKAWVWNGSKWNEENLNTDKYIKKYGSDNIISLGGNLLAAYGNGETKLIYKVDDSFVKPVGTYLVREKNLIEPVTDKVITYRYSFLSNENSKNGIAFDDASNTPLMDVMKVEIVSGNKNFDNKNPFAENSNPIEQKGIVERRLCDITDGTESVAVGSVCTEVQRNKDETSIISQTKTKFKRNRANWPYPVFVDQESLKVEIARGAKTTVQNFYSDNNGMLVERVKNIGKKTTDEKFIYLVDLAGKTNNETIIEDLKTQNRLNLLAGSYSCVGMCEKGTIVTAEANGISKVKLSEADEESLNITTSKWKFTPKSKLSEENIISQIKSISLANGKNENWERQSYNSVYANKRVVETMEGPRNVKVASFVENHEGGKLLGTAANCGIDEGLMLSGESCEINNWSGCDTLVFADGYVINTINRSGIDKKSYGRFSNSAIKLTTNTPLVGTIAKARNEEYLFSAWIQVGIEKGFLDLYINDVLKQSWELYPDALPVDSVGEWKKIEWTGMLNGNTRVKLMVRNIATNVRIQDIRVLPTKSSSTSSFWSRKWDKIQTTVDNRGVGSFVDFDDIGREYEHFSETVDGKVYLSSRKTYYDGNCSIYPDGSDNLSALLLNGRPQKIPNTENRTATYVLADPTVSIQFNAFDANDDIKYKLFPEGMNEPEEWESPCCGVLTYPSLEFTSKEMNWILKVDVSPYNKGVYTFNIKKKLNDWVEYGSLTGIAKGYNPKYESDFDSSKIVYKNKANYLYSAFYNGNEWVVNDSKLFNETISQYSTSTGTNGNLLAYVSAEELPENLSYLEYPKIYQKSNSGWMPKDVPEKTIRVENLVVSENSSKKPFVVFNKVESIGNMVNPQNTSESHAEIVDDESLCAMSWNDSKNKFEYVGSTPIFSVNNAIVDKNSKKVQFSTGDIISYQTGVVNDAPVNMVDVVKGPEGKMYVAYIGSSKYLQTCSNDGCDYEVPFVFVKMLYSPSEVGGLTQNVWAGVSQIAGKPLYQGDVLSWSGNTYDALEGAKKIKLSYNGSNLYLAVLYEMIDDDEEEEKSAGESDKTESKETKRPLPAYTLTVFKGVIETNKNIDGVNYSKYLNWVPLKDMSIKTMHYANTIEEERARVAYFNDNDDFDFAVRNEIPYIMFRNMDNKNGVSVIRFENDRWLSVGNPKFAFPEIADASADLGVNDKGNPFVIFRADESKENQKRGGKLHGMHYNPKSAPDLTLSNFETSDENFNSSCAFRQYILSYSADLEDVDNFTFKISPKTPEDVKEVQIFSKDTFVKSVSSFSNDVTIPLEKGLNKYEIRVVGTDDSYLSYDFDLYRNFVPSTGLYTVGLMVNTVISLTKDNNIVMDVTPKNISADGTVHFDLHFQAGWTFVLVEDGRKTEYTVPSTIKISVDKLPITESYMYNDNGDTIRVTIQNTKSTVVDPTVIPWYMSSSSGNLGSSNSTTELNSSSSEILSSSSILNSELSINVPDEIRNLTTAQIYATDEIYLADNVRVEGSVFAGKYANIGVSTSVSNSIYSGGAIMLRNRSRVNEAYYTTTLETQDGALYANATKLTRLNVIPIPTYQISFGNVDVIVEPGKTLSMNPGKYASFIARAETIINFAAGDYYFKSFYTDSRVKMSFAPGTRVWINGDLRIGNECSLLQPDKKGDLFVYAGGNASFETGVELQAVFVAPNAYVSLSSRSHLYGCIFSKSFNVQPNVVLE